jgi:hypothetical protein
VISKQFKHERCAHQAAYGLPGTTPTRCGMHMQSGFVNRCLPMYIMRPEVQDVQELSLPVLQAQEQAPVGDEGSCRGRVY